MFLTCPVSGDQPEKVNMTAEEEVDDDDDIPDFRTFKVSAEDAHLFVDHANGTAHHSLIDFFCFGFSLIKHSLYGGMMCHTVSCRRRGTAYKTRRYHHRPAQYLPASLSTCGDSQTGTEH